MRNRSSASILSGGFLLINFVLNAATKPDDSCGLGDGRTFSRLLMTPCWFWRREPGVVGRVHSAESVKR
jgi:hypothetical protein